MLSFAAARTSRIKIGTAVYQLPLRPTAVAAKQIATLASLSGGRLLLGLGICGEWPDEWAAAGVSPKERGARMEEGLPLLRRLLRGETVDFEGRFHTFPGIRITPPPPPVPLLVAGRAPPALRRAAKWRASLVATWRAVAGSAARSSSTAWAWASPASP